MTETKSHLERAADHYLDLREQGLPRVRAAQHAKQRFGLSDPQIRHIMAHYFLLTTKPDSIDPGVIEDLMSDYVEAVR